MLMAFCLSKCDFFCFLYPTLKDLITLEKAGITVGASTYKTSLIHVVGDILGMVDICFHSGHIAFTGCRICLIRGIYLKKKRAVVFSETIPATVNANVFVYHTYRISEDYRLGSMV